jgi:hypothetical protein
MAFGQHTIRTKRNRENFLKYLRKGYSPSKSARALDISPSSFMRWKEDDDAFREEWEEAVEEGTDGLEDICMRRAKGGSDSLMMFLLKGRRPHKYRDNAQGSGGVIRVVLSKDDQEL